MTKTAVECLFDGSVDSMLYANGYDAAKIMLGKFIRQKTGFKPEDNYIGPLPVSHISPAEATTTTATNAGPLDIIDIGNGIYWVFAADSVASTSHRISLFVYDENQNQINHKGHIQVTVPTTGTMSGLRAVRHLHTAGTVAVTTGGVITGTSTSFNGGGGATPAAGGFSVGSRIGFGTTDPAAVTLWYQIGSITNDTSAALVSTVLPTAIASGTSYVVEEIRIYITSICSTTTDGGLRVVKGLQLADFNPRTSTSIAAASTTDNTKAVYWLKDASTVTNIAAGGIAIKEVSNSSTLLYVPNGSSTTLRIFKYEGRTALAGTLTAGATTAALTLQTGDQSVTGNLQNKQSTCLASPTSPSGEAVFVVTTSRVCRCPTSGITGASTTFVADSMTEVPPGTTATFPARGNWSSIAYSDVIDKFLIGPGVQANRAYCTAYNSSGSALDRIFFACSRQSMSAASDYGKAIYPTSTSGSGCIATKSGLAFFSTGGSGATLNAVTVVPIAADWDFAIGTNDATQNRLILPSFNTDSYRKYYRVYVLSNLYEGSPTMGTQVAPYRIFYRKSTDITGDVENWTQVAEDGDLTGVAIGGVDIQFMLEFRVLNALMVMPKIYGLVLECEDNSTDSHYEPSLKHSDPANNRFAWRFKTAFGGTVPTLFVKIDDDDGVNLDVTDDTATPSFGTFEKSTNDGGVWGSYNTTDKSNEITYIRYTLTSPGSTTRAQAKLQQ